MLRCTYIVLIQNDEDNIPDLVNSLKKVDGNFRKEYIFVDDGSTDESLSILKMAVNDMPRTTIITQSNQGPAISVNKATNLATGDYIHFVEGCEVLHPESTSILLESCLNFGTQVAIGNVAFRTFTEEKIEEKPDLILMDIQLNGISGIDLIKELKQNNTTKHIPIIAITAFAMKNDEAKISKSGCDMYISKPVSIDIFFKAVNKFVKPPHIKEQE